jgi:hypothetical protein
MWRDSWVTMINSQLQAVSEYEALYDPIVGASDGHGRETIPTPELQLHRTFKLKEAYAELKSEILEEIASIDVRVLRPAQDARDCIQPIRKTIKKRENKRLDLEKCMDKVAKLQRKHNRTPKEDSQLSKTEDESSILSNVSLSWEHLGNSLLTVSRVRNSVSWMVISERLSLPSSRHPSA